MFKRLLPAVAVLAVLVGLLLWRPWSDPKQGVAPVDSPSSDRPQPQQTADAPVQPVRERRPPAVKQKKKVSKQERERYRRAIRDALSKRPAARPSEKSRPPNREDQEVEPPSSGELKDRSGGKLAGLLKDLQDDVMPLADECYELARERDPTLEGGLDLQFEIIGDEDVGGLVESVDLVESSDIQDAEMIECMRETLLSTVFPAPDDSGATGVQLSLRFSPEE